MWEQEAGWPQCIPHQKGGSNECVLLTLELYPMEYVTHT